MTMESKPLERSIEKSKMAVDRDTLARFIERYHYHTCLWNTSNPEYTDRHKRLTALQDLASILGEGATIDRVRKKIDILRNGFFREQKKIKANLSINEGYVPTLWYYNMLTFLEENKQRGDLIDVEQTSRLSPVAMPVTQSTLLYTALSRPSSVSMSASQQTLYDTSQITGDMKNEIKWKKRRSSRNQDEFNVAERMSTPDYTENADKCIDNTFGLYISRQLQDLSMDQKIIAEKLMSDILYFARTNQLSENTQIVPNNETVVKVEPYVTFQE